MKVHVQRGESGALKRLGRIHMTVFDPDGRRVVGFLVKRPDVAGMVKRSDRLLLHDLVCFFPFGGGIDQFFETISL